MVLGHRRLRLRVRRDEHVDAPPVDLPRPSAMHRARLDDGRRRGDVSRRGGGVVTGWYIVLAGLVCVFVALAVGRLMAEGDIEAPAPDPPGSFDEAPRVFSERIPRVLDDNEVA